MALPKVLTIKQCSDLSGIPESGIRRLIKNNDLSHFKVGNKYYINTDMFFSFIREPREKTTEQKKKTGEKNMEEVSYSSMTDDELRKESFKLADDRTAYFDRKIPEMVKNPWLPNTYVDRMLAYLGELHSPGYREKFADDIYHTMVDMIRRGQLS